jgi:hypothetical protein
MLWPQVRPRISKSHAACQKMALSRKSLITGRLSDFDPIRTITTVRKLPISHLLFYDTS